MSKTLEKPLDLTKLSCPVSWVNITETAGFVPLEVRFKRMEQNGYVANFYAEQFDSSEIQDIFLGDDTAIYADDDEETIAKKLYLQDKKKAEYMKLKLGDLVEANESSSDNGAGSRSSEDKSPSQRFGENNIQNSEDSGTSK